MPEIYIGTGGWHYFKIPDIDPLREYSKIFNFVEVNATFYKHIPLDVIETWRRRVPKSFRFSLRVNRVVTHKYHLKPIKEVIESMDYALTAAEILDSDVLVLETPPGLVLTENMLKEFLARIDLQNRYLAIEARGRVDVNAVKYMENRGDIVYVYDISREEPPYYNSDIDYTRIFGKGSHNVYQFTNSELKDIYRKASNTPAKRILMSFHGVKMYTDAGKLRYYHLYKDFPKNKPPYGLEAIKLELSRDMIFPSTKDEIIRHEGWKVIPLDEKRDIHLGDILSWLPPGKYGSPEEVITALKKLKIFRDKYLR